MDIERKNELPTGKELAGYISLGDFALMNRLKLRDLNSYFRDGSDVNIFRKFSKDDIARYLANPAKYEKQLRRAVRYIYGASPHFRRIIQYFVGLSDLSYVIEPYNINPKKSNARIVENNYRHVLKVIESLDVKTQLPKILTVCLREDTYYGTMWIVGDSITIQQLPSDFCAISSIEGNVPNVAFDFTYFDRYPTKIDYFPEEFRRKYEQYKNNINYRWIELDAPYSFAVKCNADILDYSIPPFAGILRELYDIEDYRNLKLAKTALENYAMLVMTLPLTKEGDWGIDLDKAREFFMNLSSELPEEVGAVLSPMDIKKISFERSNVGDTDTIAEAEENLFTAAGVSSLLFNNPKASANALLLSIKADQAVTYGIVKSIGDVLNRFLRVNSYGKYFKINFLDVSPFNRKEMGDAYLKAASFGIPTISAYAASQGIGQAELDTMSYLEGTVLRLQDMFRPIQSSSQMNSDDLNGGGATDEGGAPEKDMEDLTESGEQNREDA